MLDSTNPEYVSEIPTSSMDDTLNKDTRGHFLTEEINEEIAAKQGNKEIAKETIKGRHELLEYYLRNDGCVICKTCGEVLQTRTHWYRHKYKRHNTQPPNNAPLFRCEQCPIYFKSRKGYIGHIASRHNDFLSDSSPVLTTTQAESTQTFAMDNPSNIQFAQEMKEEPDPESVIPKSSVRNYQTSVLKQGTKSAEPKKTNRVKVPEPIVNQADWDARRSREEKLVADIIDRVRRECEAQPPAPAPAPARRSYARRTSVMHSHVATNRRTIVSTTREVPLK